MRANGAAAVVVLLNVAGLVPRFVVALWTRCNLDDVIDTGSSPLLTDFWNSFVRNSSKLHIDSGTALDEARFFKRWAYILTKSDEMIQVVAEDCLFGLLTLLLQAVPAVDYESGRAEALAMLQMARVVLEQALQLEDFDVIASEASALGWEVAALRNALQVYEMLLVDIPALATLHGCHGPRLYVYPPPATPPPPSSTPDVGESVGQSTKQLLHSSPDTYLQALARGPLQCVFGMYGTEYVFHRRFLASPCRVDDPALADLFFVPSYFKCIEVLNYVEHFDAEESEASKLFRQTVDHVRTSGPWFDRFDGSDHIFLFSWGRFPCSLVDWRLGLRSAIALQVENHCEDLNSEGPQPSFNRWKDIIIPGHIDFWRVLELRRSNMPFEMRDVLLAFHGRHAGNTASYANVSVRTQILGELDGLPGVSVGGFIEGYHALLGQSIFCLAPRGITPWTVHLYVAILAGCIPVILSDDYEVPFQGIIDWPSFTVKWPMEAAGRELYGYLSSLAPQLVIDMKQKVDEHACWFDYYSPEVDCSPYHAVMSMLQERHARRPPFAGRFWGPGGMPVHPTTQTRAGT